MHQRWIVLLGFLSACQPLGRTIPQQQAGEPPQPPSVLDTPVDFSGWHGATRNPHELGEIRIGFFAPNEADHPVGGPVFSGATLAIEQVNAAGGFDGVPLRLVQRWVDDPWRGGSKEMIRLVYEDSVWAVIGSLSGAATHVAEQVVTKAWVPLLAPVSADPTLTYIRIPWMFRLPPDDQRQAEAIVREGIQASSLENVGLITSTDHDGRTFAAEMLDRMQAEHVPPVFHFQVSLPSIGYDEIAQRVKSFHPGGVIVRLPPAEMLVLLDHFRHSRFRAPLLIPWIPGLLPTDLRKHYDWDILYVQPFTEASNRAHAAFARTYQERYGAEPTPSAAYAYDAVMLLVQSLAESGLNRSRLRDFIAGNSGFHGVTGTISWDNAGGNQANPVLRILPGASVRND